MNNNFVNIEMKIECIPDKNIHYYITWLNGPGPGPTSYDKCVFCGKIKENGR